jgi:hypothetical protein
MSHECPNSRPGRLFPFLCEYPATIQKWVTVHAATFTAAPKTLLYYTAPHFQVFTYFRKNQLLTCDILGSHGGEYEDDSFWDIALCRLVEVHRYFRTVHTASIIMARQYVRLKRRSTSKRLHSAVPESCHVHTYITVKLKHTCLDNFIIMTCTNTNRIIKDVRIISLKILSVTLHAIFNGACQ